MHWSRRQMILDPILDESADIQVFPNPASGSVNFHIGGMNQPLMLVVVDVSGKIMDNRKVENELTLINTLSYSNGLYFYRICDNSGGVIHSGTFCVNK